MDDHKLLQESNLTAWQPCMTPIMLYISFNKRRRLANEVNIVNITGIQDWNSVCQHHVPNVNHYSTAPPVEFCQCFLPLAITRHGQHFVNQLRYVFCNAGGTASEINQATKDPQGIVERSKCL